MSLQIVAGPPNSGRAGEIRRRFQAALHRDPLLIVPTWEDVARFEEELCAEGAVLGGAVRTFDGLFEAVAAALGTASPPGLDAVQRRRLVREALRRAEPRRLRAPGRSDGLARLVDEAIADVQAALVEPGDLAERVRRARGPEQLAELAAVYRAYAELRDGMGRTDAGARQAQTLRALAESPEAWGARPVMLYGFDDLTESQLRLVEALGRAAEVTIAIAFEDRPALAARARLRARLTECGGTLAAELRPDPANTESPTLFHLERSFLDDAAEPRDPDDGGLVLIEAAGERGEARMVAARVRELLAAGEPAEQIAVVLRSPGESAAVWEQELAACGVPAAVDGGLAFPATATGRGALAALRAAGPEGTAADLVSYLRTPGLAPSGRVDRLERRIRTAGLQSATEALEAWEEGEQAEPRELRELREAGPRGGQLARSLARACRALSQLPVRRSDEIPGEAERRELRAGEEAAQVLESLAELPLACEAPDLVAALSELHVPLWRSTGSGPRGRVRVLSPYRARARRFAHLVVASLQEGEFPRRDPGSPLLGDTERAMLELPPRASVEEEERYLFHACLARPTRTLTLSRRAVDEDGGALEPSPFLAEVRSLLSPEPPTEPGATDPLRELLVRARSLADTVLPPLEAPSRRELARALAAFPGERARWAERPEARKLIEAVESAAKRAGALPGPLRDPAVLAELRARPALSASQLEEYRRCSYRWFVEHELGPQPLDPDPEQRADGTIAHEVLERLYADPPAGAVPRPDTLDRWRKRTRALIDEVAAENNVPDGSLGWRTRRRKLHAHLERFLAREAMSESALRPDPELLELAFGLEGEEVVDVGGVPLRGKIDRVDTAQGADGVRLGLVRDYKLSRGASGAPKLREEGKLQLQLYALALRERLGIEPIGALYEALAAPEGDKPRGIVNAEHAELLAAGDELVSTDVLKADRFEAELQDAESLAGELAAGIRAGRIARDPLGGECPHWCTFAAICRRERGVPEVIPEEDEDEGEGA